MEARQIPDHQSSLLPVYSRQPHVVATDSGSPSWVFIGGIPKQATRKEIINYVCQFGKLKYFALPHNKNEQEGHKGFSKVLFEKTEDMLAFINFKNHRLHGVSIGVSQWVAKRDHKSKKEIPSVCKLFFKFKVAPSQNELYDHFSQFGLINNIEIKVNYRTNQIRDFGFVIFADPISTQRALGYGTLHMIGRKSILVFNSKSQSEFMKEKLKSPKDYGKTKIFSGEERGFQTNAFQFDSNLQSSKTYQRYSFESDPNYNKPPQEVPDRFKKGAPIEGACLIKEAFCKPTSKKWHHSKVSNRHTELGIICFRPTGCSNPREPN